MKTMKPDLRIELAYYRVCSGMRISMMDLPKIVKKGAEAINNGADDKELDRVIFEYVKTLKV